jgi:hypothetical protein
MSGLSIAMKHSPDADEMSIPTPESIESFLKERPEFKNDTMLPLLRKLAVIRDVSVVGACPELERWYKDNSTVLNDHIYDRVEKEMPPLDRPGREALKNAILKMSAPAISDDGNTAYFYIAEATQTAGGRFAITYKKNAEGNWHLKSKDPTGGVP